MGGRVWPSTKFRCGCTTTNGLEPIASTCGVDAIVAVQPLLYRRLVWQIRSAGDNGAVTLKGENQLADILARLSLAQGHEEEEEIGRSDLASLIFHAPSELLEQVLVAANVTIDCAALLQLLGITPD